VLIVNCARGGLVHEGALAEALSSGQVAGAALDVYETEPARENPLFAYGNVVCTPHLGASTREAQDKVAVQIAEQMSEFLVRGAIANAVNFPAVTAEEAPRLAPWIRLAEQLGSFAGQLTTTPIVAVQIAYSGELTNVKTGPLSAAALAGVLRPVLADVNMVSAPLLAKDRGIDLEEIKRSQETVFESLLRITIRTEAYQRSVAGTVFSDGRARVVEVRDIPMEFEFAPHMLFVRNTDRPGFIGRFGTLLGAAGVNIATFNLGRERPGGDAICMVAVDEPVSDAVLADIGSLPNVMRVRRLEFP
jgi:D-3-phosphoglycerate dehydrogenase